MDTEVVLLLPTELAELDTGPVLLLLLAGDGNDEGPPPVADHPVVGHVRGVVVLTDGVPLGSTSVVELEFPYGPVELAEAELEPPVDRVTELPG